MSNMVLASYRPSCEETRKINHSMSDRGVVAERSGEEKHFGLNLGVIKPNL